MPKKKYEEGYDKSPEGIAYRRSYNETHYSHIGLYLDPALKDRVDAFIKAHGISRNKFAVDAFTEYLDKQDG